ncbi:phosphoethanolamine transferase [Diaphorobacter sp.]|uniref:phosphoethanolamine transferase n=1 Tax=Diaphorobacter sp. TaxID=1934310 RepID=UPI0028ADA0FB|nr:phosphoethanolamine transferase [Diaphorobacter sp.]
MNERSISKRFLCWMGCACYFLMWMPCFLGTESLRAAAEIDFWQTVFLGLIFWVTLLALTKYVWMALAIATPAAIFFVLELWVRLYQGHPIDAHIVSIWKETNWQESFDFLSAYGWPVVGLTFSWLLVYSYFIYVTKKLNVGWIHSSRKWVLAIFLPFLALFLWTFGALGESRVETNEEILEGVGHSAVGVQWGGVFPVNIATAIEQFHKQQQRLDRIQTVIAERKLHATQKPAKNPEIVVLVIGESATMTHWPASGYERDTTPLIGERDNIAIFSNVVSLSAATRTAVPGVLAHRPVLTPNGTVDWNAEPSLVQAFKEVGYKTHWISNQAPFGRHDTAISVYAREAEDIRFLNIDTYARKSNYDSVLLPAFEGVLKQPGRHFVVMHLLGSHFDYSNRYPKEFDHFIPTSRSISTPTPEQLNNSYDNSIRYTDYILDKIIQHVEATGKNAVVTYFSDHGVDPVVGSCATQNGVRRSEAAFRVPAFVWLSNEYMSINAFALEKLKSNTSQPYMSRAMYSTILALSDVELNEGLPEENFLIPSSVENKRRIPSSNGSYVNFDEAISVNSCNINSVLGGRGSEKR